MSHNTWRPRSIKSRIKVLLSCLLIRRLDIIDPKYDTAAANWCCLYSIALSRLTTESDKAALISALSRGAAMLMQLPGVLCFSIKIFRLSLSKPEVQICVNLDGATVKIQNSGRPRSVRDEETIEEVEVSVRQNPSLSIRKRSQAFNIKKSFLHSILKKDLHLKAYKIQLVQEMKDTDYANRLNFANEMLQRFNKFNNILFSDEANFHLNGHVNKQNCRYWAVENPRRKHERPLHSPKVVVWAAISAKGIIGPYFYEDQRGRAINE